MPNESTYRDCKCKPDEISHNADYVHNSSTPVHCCDNDKCECHHPLRLWAIKYEVLGVPKFSGVAIVQAKDLCNAELVFIQNSKFNGMREYLKITCIDELYPNPEPLILQEDSAAILDKRILKTYPFLLRSEYCEKSQELNDTIIQNVQDYIGDIRPHIDSTTGNWFIGDQDTGVHAQGDKGEDGNDGADGFSPSVSVSKSGNTTTISVTDEQGTTSSTITDGSNGESAYEIWLEQGHTGTEEDFLNWLREGEYLKQIKNLDDYEGEIGEIVQYKGETNSKYTNGFNYKKVGVRRVIQPGTRYIEINDSTGELLKVGVPNGRYYNIDEYEEIVWHTYYLGSPTIGEIPVKSDERGFNLVTNIGSYAIVNNKFLKITSVRNLDGNGYLKVGYTYGSGRNSIIGFEDGTEIELNNQGRGVESPITQRNLSVYESQDGIRIYQWYPGYSDSVLTTEDWGDAKRAISFSTFIIRNTTEEIIIDTTEWQQWDSQPRDDTSHFVTDSDIGWIEH